MVRSTRAAFAIAAVLAVLVGSADAGAAGFDPRTLHALPASTATGPAVPDLRTIVLDGSLGFSTSLEPTLKWGTQQATFRITDLAGDGDHWAAEIVTPEFAGKSRVQQHQLVNAALKEALAGPLHALSLTTRAPA